MDGTAIIEKSPLLNDELTIDLPPETIQPKQQAALQGASFERVNQVPKLNVAARSAVVDDDQDVRVMSPNERNGVVIGINTEISDQEHMDKQMASVHNAKSMLSSKNASHGRHNSVFRENHLRIASDLPGIDSDEYHSRPIESEGMHARVSQNLKAVL